MSTNLTVNGVTYAYPQTGDQNWGSAATLWATAVTSGMLQKAGGTFTLTADANFGTSYGLLAKYFTTTSSNAATAGVVRLASAEAVSFRNNANNADLLLTTDASDNLLFNGHIIDSSSGVVPVAGGGTGLASYTAGDMLYASGSTTLAKLAIGAANTVQVSTGSAPSWATIVNANVNASAAIAYSKLSLTGSILNADINASAAIAYSKLNLTGAVLNADLAGSIAYSKLSLTGAILNADLAGSIAYSKLSLTGAVLNADLAGSIAASKLVGSDIATVGAVTAGTWSATTIALNKGGTGQTTKAAAFDALQPMTTSGDIIYGGTSGTGTRLAKGSDTQVLTLASGLPSWAAPTVAITNNYYSGWSAGGWTTTSTSYADGTNSGGNALTQRFANGLTVTAGGSNVAGITFTPSSSANIYFVMANTNVRNQTIATESIYKLTDGTNVVASRYMQGSGVNDESPIILAGIYAPGTGAAVTLKIQLKTDTSGTAEIKGGLSDSAIEWTLIQIK